MKPETTVFVGGSMHGKVVEEAMNCVMVPHHVIRPEIIETQQFHGNMPSVVHQCYRLERYTLSFNGRQRILCFHILDSPCKHRRAQLYEFAARVARKLIAFNAFERDISVAVFMVTEDDFSLHLAATLQDELAQVCSVFTAKIHASDRSRNRK